MSVSDETVTSSPLNAVTRYDVEDDVAVITVDNPPVNALGHAVRTGIAEGLDRALHDHAIGAVVLCCAGRTFFAGADITEFGKPMASPVLRELAVIMEAAGKPIVAAIHGTALGGGLETALACHWRIAAPGAKLGLPEVKLGLLAGAGGTQRLPRLVGAGKALDMVVSGDPISADDALAHGLIDAIAGSDLRADAMTLARAAMADQQPLRRVRDRTVPPVPASLFATFRGDQADRLRGFEAPEASIRCIEAAVSTDFDEGMRIERELFEDLMLGTQCAAQRYAFFAERDAAKVPGLAKAKPAPVDRLVISATDPLPAGFVARCHRAGIAIEPADTPLPQDGGAAPWIFDFDAGLAFIGVSSADAIFATTSADVPAIRFRLAPQGNEPSLMEFVHDENFTAGEFTTLLALAKRLALPVVVTLTGDDFVGARMADALARAQARERDSAAGLAMAADRFGVWLDGARLKADLPPDDAALERLIVAQINEGARLLESGAAARASDIDIACIKQGLWKVYRGGPMFHADQLGLARVVAALRALELRHGSELAPAPLLVSLSDSGSPLHTYP